MCFGRNHKNLLPGLLAGAWREHETALIELLRRSHLNGLRVQVHPVGGESRNVIPMIPTVAKTTSCN